MKNKKHNRRNNPSNKSTMRTEYDFAEAVRGATVARYAQSLNVVVFDPAELDVFPDGSAVNETLKALSPLIRR